MSSSKDHFTSKSTHNRDKGMFKKQQKTSTVTKRSSGQPTWRGRGSSGSGIAPFQARPPSTSGRRLQRAQQGLEEKWFDGVRVTELGALRPDPAAALAVVYHFNSRAGPRHTSRRGYPVHRARNAPRMRLTMPAVYMPLAGVMSAVNSPGQAREKYLCRIATKSDYDYEFNEDRQ
ncbi:hypothetical protein CSIM01_05976 [Colletotrichum simmondsii]|uniref:Uncharacterized protein n=1 Tax=Colletotrichum simmondsii TaxID=703756 RepID=A0A135T3X8_9PEZI|nr:hypothetical protein CSIM01_05976 [Colletotrichum simmondsii]